MKEHRQETELPDIRLELSPNHLFEEPDLSEQGVRHSELVPFPSYHVRIIGDVS